MFCKECGKKLEEGTKFCPDCGAPTEGRKGEEIQNENQVKESVKKLPWWKKIFMRRKGCVIVAVLVLIAIIAGNAENGSTNENTGKIDLYEFVDYTEDDLVEKLGFEKNEMGFYPSDSCINIICIEGKVYGLEINRGQEEAELLSVCGIALDDSKESVDVVLQEKFEYIAEHAIPEGMCYCYLDCEKKNMLMLECDEEQIITRISYVTDKEVINDTLSLYE